MKRNLLAVVAVCMASIVFAETSDAQRRFAVEMEMALKDKGSAKNRQSSTILRGADPSVTTSTNAQSCIPRPFYRSEIVKSWMVRQRVKDVDDTEARQATEKMFDLWVETLEAYKASHGGALPDEKDREGILSDASHVDRNALIQDAWGSPIMWTFIRGEVTGSYGIVSPGPDMVLDTNDDIVRGDPAFISLEKRRSMLRGNDRFNRQKTEKMLDLWVSTLEAYKSEHGGELPGEDDQARILAEASHMDPNRPVRDVWGRPIVCIRGRGSDRNLYEFVSMGPDRSPNTDDDIVRGDAFRLREAKEVVSPALLVSAETNEIQKAVLEMRAKMEMEERQRAPRQRALAIERTLAYLERKELLRFEQEVKGAGSGFPRLRRGPGEQSKP